MFASKMPIVSGFIKICRFLKIIKTIRIFIAWHLLWYISTLLGFSMKCKIFTVLLISWCKHFCSQKYQPFQIWKYDLSWVIIIKLIFIVFIKDWFSALGLLWQQLPKYTRLNIYAAHVYDVLNIVNFHASMMSLFRLQSVYIMIIDDNQGRHDVMQLIIMCKVPGGRAVRYESVHMRDQKNA